MIDGFFKFLFLFNSYNINKHSELFEEEEDEEEEEEIIKVFV